MNERNILWQTRDGQQIPIRNMADEHLINTLLYLNRRVKLLAEETDAAYSCSVQGDIASYYAAQGQNDAHAKETACRMWIELFKRELDRRVPPKSLKRLTLVGLG